MSGSRRRALAALVAAPLVLFSAKARSQQRLNTPLHASASERLALLAERIGKCHVQLAQGVLAERARRALRESSVEFDASLPAVAGLAGDAEARDNFTLLALLWKQLREWSRRPPTRENARQVSERAEEVAWIAQKGARLIRAEGAGEREALNAMRAGTLAQRVARLALLKRIAAPDARRDADLVDAIAQLGSLISALASSPHLIEIEDDLRMAQAQHEFLLAALRDHATQPNAASAETIAKTADHVAESMERAARLYEGGGS